MAENQCDGCRRGLPLVDGKHTGPGGFWAGDVQACTADRYVETDLDRPHFDQATERYHRELANKGKVRK